jgi:hypothetical protein
VQQQLGKLGIKASLRYEDVPTWLRRIYTNYGFELTNNWIQTLADPVIGPLAEHGDARAQLCLRPTLTFVRLMLILRGNGALWPKVLKRWRIYEVAEWVDALLTPIVYA